jgi:hypothetical protein
MDATLSFVRQWFTWTAIFAGLSTLAVMWIFMLTGPGIFAYIYGSLTGWEALGSLMGSGLAATLLARTIEQKFPSRARHRCGSKV